MQSGGKFRLEVVKPDGPVLSESVDEVVIPGFQGFFGVLKGHAPLLALLGTGEMWYRVDSAKHYLALVGGFCEVGPERVTILAEAAERAEDIDITRAQRAHERAESRARRAVTGTDTEEMEKSRVALERAALRLSVASRCGAVSS